MSESEHTSDEDLEQLGSGPDQIGGPEKGSEGLNQPKVDTEGVAAEAPLTARQIRERQECDQEIEKAMREILFEDEAGSDQGVDLREDLFTVMRYDEALCYDWRDDPSEEQRGGFPTSDWNMMKRVDELDDKLDAEERQEEEENDGD